MSKLTTALAVIALSSAVATGTALAGEDEDTFPSDPGTALTVYHADGTVTQSTQTIGAGSFFKQLVAEHAAGGSYAQTTISGAHQDTLVVGTVRPSGTRYTRLARERSRASALAKISEQSTIAADGRRVTERGYAVDTASGRIRRVTLEQAKRLSADPRGGVWGLEYVYSVSLHPIQG